MRPFVYERPDGSRAAIAAATSEASGRRPAVTAPGQFIAGGTNLLDYMKLGVTEPSVLVDVNGLDREGLARIEIGEKAIRFGALVRMAEAETHAAVQRRFPVIVDSLRLAASPQIRNVASLAGNVLQRTRCEYFREISWPCNKRQPGSGCAAMEGFNRQHAVLGTSEACIATYHGDFAQALIALDAVVEIDGPSGSREIAFADLHRLPGQRPDVETRLEPGEIILAIRVPALPWASRSRYVKVRDRESYAFALASAAVALDLEGETVRDVRIALGGLATVPWRAKAAEDNLRGRPLTEATAREAAEIAFTDARTRQHNAFKPALGQRTLVRTLFETRDMKV